MMVSTFSDSIKHIDSVENSPDNDSKINVSAFQLGIIEQISQKSSMVPIISHDKNNCSELRWYAGTNIYYLEIKQEDLFWITENKSGYGFYKCLECVEDVFVEMREIGVLKE